MARRTPPPVDDDFTERIVDIDVSSEMQTSFLEYAYSVIYSRALPDARDGLKPVQRRILYSMQEMGVRPDRGHVKCARVVGEVMGKYHPHGDGAIYDALVRTAQWWTMRLTLVDGHGNFGSPDAGPAAMRYTECRMAPAALSMTDGLDSDTVDFKPNYDGKDDRAHGAAGRVPEPAGQRGRRHRRRHGHQLRPAQPDRGDPGAAPPDQAPERRPRHADAVHPRTRPARRRQDHRAGRHPGCVRDGQGQLPDPGHHPDRAGAPAPQGHRGHRAAVHGRPGAGDRADQDPGHQPQAAGHRRRQGPHRPDQRHPPGDRDQERLQPRGDPRAALPGHQAGGLLRDQLGGAGRRAAAHAVAQGDADGLPRAPLRGDPPAHRVRPHQGCSTGCTWSRVC